MQGHGIEAKRFQGYQGGGPPVVSWPASCMCTARGHLLYSNGKVQAITDLFKRGKTNVKPKFKHSNLFGILAQLLT